MRQQEMGWPALGYVVENAVLGQVLLQALATEPAVRVISPARVSVASPHPGGYQLVLEGDDAPPQLHTSLLVIADGAGSGLCRSLGIAVERRDYAQTAIIANVACLQPHRQVAYERFSDEGPLALLPLAGLHGDEHRAALVWSLATPAADRLLAADDQVFLQRLQQQFGDYLGRLVRVGRRNSFPLSLQTATEQVRSHLVVMGNAAHSLHPVAGQGFNLALRDADRLCSTLHAASGPGDLSRLQHYLQRQQPDQWRTITLSDQLVRCFASERAWLGPARDLGLFALDAVAPWKKQFARYAAGRNDGAAIGL